MLGYLLEAYVWRMLSGFRTRTCESTNSRLLFPLSLPERGEGDGYIGYSHGLCQSVAFFILVLLQNWHAKT